MMGDRDHGIVPDESDFVNQSLELQKPFFVHAFNNEAWGC
jgi:hypothetical protein